MAILSAMINILSCYSPEVLEQDSDAGFENAAARLISKVRTIAAASYKASVGERMIYPRPDYSYCENFLHMMFSQPNDPYVMDADVVQALNLILLLHADHEQKLLDLDRPHGRQQRGRTSVRKLRRGGLCPLGAAARRGERRGASNQLQTDSRSPALTSPITSTTSRRTRASSSASATACTKTTTPAPASSRSPPTPC